MLRVCCEISKCLMSVSLEKLTAGIKLTVQMEILSPIPNLTFCCLSLRLAFFLYYIFILFGFFFTQCKLVMWWYPTKKKTAHRTRGPATSNVAWETTEPRATVNNLGDKSVSKKPTQSPLLFHTEPGAKIMWVS